MAYPTPIIEIAFDDGPYVVSPTWTDVTTYVRGFETSRGVPDDWTLQADGSATVTLSNRDRRFDPFNTSGPYYGKLLPRRQIRIRATSGGTTYDVFRGFIAGWPPEWTDAGYDSTVTLSCFDALQLLGSSSMPADWAEQYIFSLSPSHYWEMDDPIAWYNSAPITLRDRGSTPSALVTNPPYTYQGSGIAAGLPSQSLANDWWNSTASQVDNYAPNTSSSFTVAYWTRSTNSDLTGCYITAMAFGGQISMWVESDISNPKYGIFHAVYTTATGFSLYESTVTYQPTEPHHFAFTFNVGTATGKIYIDGLDVTSAKTSGSGGIISAWETFDIVIGEFQQLVFFPSVLTQSQIREIVRLGEAQYPETTSARVSRIIGHTPFNASLVNATASPASEVLGLTPDAPTAASELTKVSDSEYAPLFVNKAGTLTLYSQSQIRTQSSSIVSQVTYGNGGVAIGPDVQLQYDGDSMRNVANVEMTSGGVYITENSTAVAAYGESEQYLTTQLATVADADAVADIITGWGGQVYAKASPVSVVLSPNGSWGSTLALELFDRFTLAVAPKTGNVITTPMLLSRVSHSATPERWVTTVEGSARWAAVFILNQSTLGGTDLLG